MTFMDIEELKQELVRIESSIKTITGGRLMHSVLRTNGVINKKRPAKQSC